MKIMKFLDSKDKKGRIFKKGMDEKLLQLLHEPRAPPPLPDIQAVRRGAEWDAAVLTLLLNLKNSDMRRAAGRSRQHTAAPRRRRLLPSVAPACCAARQGRAARGVQPRLKPTPPAFTIIA